MWCEHNLSAGTAGNHNTVQQCSPTVYVHSTFQQAAESPLVLRRIAFLEQLALFVPQCLLELAGEQWYAVIS